MEGGMLVSPINRTGWQAINRRVVELQQKTHAQNELATLEAQSHKVDHDADLPFSRAEVRLEIQKVWWQL
jgi:hypothetical protein